MFKGKEKLLFKVTFFKKEMRKVSIRWGENDCVVVSITPIALSRPEDPRHKD